MTHEQHVEGKILTPMTTKMRIYVLIFLQSIVFLRAFDCCTE
jgi:hypothetical protein